MNHNKAEQKNWCQRRGRYLCQTDCRASLQLRTAPIGRAEVIDSRDDSQKQYIPDLEQDRKSVMKGKSVDLGGRRIIKIKNKRDIRGGKQKKITMTRVINAMQ